ncbi:hypothetical protein OE749_02365 [Aestuariibacter sp. AA17]|uniref:Hemerythrin-like domain-containing protein n=1 Tax=Fluctibacter corallii TaxID=2984329 RepID=A0ABT3A4F3_9ALTE|nr:hypothetical protein [Aestuariibacter sp. AA17]MCV2883541.1 hypothetical protein [Aestuariibacter sp. AA17]
MHNFSDVRELLHHNQRFHDRASLYYRELASKVSDERVRMLLDTLSTHEVILSNELKRYVEQAPDAILNTYYQFDHEYDVNELFAIASAPHECNVNDIEQLATRLDDYLQTLYSKMAQGVDSENVREVFENLSNHMQEEKKKLSTDLYSMLDI